MGIRLGALVGVCAVVACGGGDGGGGGSGFTAVIDGEAWAAEPIGVTALAGGVPGGVVVVGSKATGGGPTRSLSISLGAITGPGTYALGVGPRVYGGIASVGEGTGSGGNANVWQTPLSGVAGSIEITRISEGRLVATFAFEAEPGKNNALGGTRSVTSGKIDLPLMGTLPPVADNHGSKLSAVLNGKRYNAWSANGRLMDISGGAGVVIDTSSSENAVSISLSDVSAPGTYTFSNRAPVRTLIVGFNSTDPARCCWGLNAGNDTISVTITSLTPARVKGTFSGTLQPQPNKPATAPMVVTEGSFDVGTGP